MTPGAYCDGISVLNPNRSFGKYDDFRRITGFQVIAKDLCLEKNQHVAFLELKSGD